MLASCSSTSSPAVRATTARVVCGACILRNGSRNNNTRSSSSSSGRVAVGPKLLRGNIVVSDAADACRRRSDSHVASAAAEAAAYGAPPATNPEAYIVLVSVVVG